MGPGVLMLDRSRLNGLKKDLKKEFELD